MSEALSHARARLHAAREETRDVMAHDTDAAMALFDLIEAVELLINAVETSTETRCTCGFGGFHDDVNPRCDRNTPQP